MTPALATALAAAAVRIHAALRDLGDRPSVFQREARTQHVIAAARIAASFGDLQDIPLPQDLTSEAPWIRLHTTYAPDSGALTEACVVVVLCGVAFGSVSASIPVGPVVTTNDVLMAWNASIRTAWDDEVKAHRARLDTLSGLLVFPGDAATP